MIISTLFGLTFFFIGLRGLYNFDKGYIKTSGIYESKEIYSIPDDEDLEGNYGWMCYERDLFDNKIKEMYNISSNTVSRPTLSELGDAKKI